MDHFLETFMAVNLALQMHENQNRVPSRPWWKKPDPPKRNAFLESLGDPTPVDYNLPPNELYMALMDATFVNGKDNNKSKKRLMKKQQRPKRSVYPFFANNFSSGVDGFSSAPFAFFLRAIRRSPIAQASEIALQAGKFVGRGSAQGFHRSTAAQGGTGRWHRPTLRLRDKARKIQKTH